MRHVSTVVAIVVIALGAWLCFDAFRGVEQIAGTWVSVHTLEDLEPNTLVKGAAVMALGAALLRWRRQ